MIPPDKLIKGQEKDELENIRQLGQLLGLSLLGILSFLKENPPINEEFKQ